MKRLILMRHAKSDWSNTGATDIQRTLNERGEAAALVLGAWLRDHGYLPDQVLCSAATRTRQTLEGLDLAQQTDVAFRGDLYLAEPDEMAAALRAATQDCVLMIGHNPGIAELAQFLVAEPPNHDEFDRYPTGATLIVDFDIGHWSDLEMHSGTTINFVVPRELTS